MSSYSYLETNVGQVLPSYFNTVHGLETEIPEFNVKNTVLATTSYIQDAVVATISSI